MPVLFKTFLINNNAKIGLSECNLNNYHAILRKRDRGLIDAFDTSACPIIAQRPQKDNSEDEYYKNKTVVKQLKRKYRMAFSPEEVQKIIADYLSGKTGQEMSIDYKCSKTTIIKLLKEQGVDVRKDKARAKLDDDMVIDMYRQMKTAQQIAKHFGVSKQVILQCLKKHGVKLRTRWDYPKEK